MRLFQVLVLFLLASLPLAATLFLEAARFETLPAGPSPADTMVGSDAKSPPAASDPDLDLF